MISFFKHPHPNILVGFEEISVYYNKIWSLNCTFYSQGNLQKSKVKCLSIVNFIINAMPSSWFFVVVSQFFRTHCFGQKQILRNSNFGLGSLRRCPKSQTENILYLICVSVFKFFKFFKISWKLFVRIFQFLELKKFYTVQKPAETNWKGYFLRWIWFLQLLSLFSDQTDLFHHCHCFLPFHFRPPSWYTFGRIIKNTMYSVYNFTKSYTLTWDIMHCFAIQLFLLFNGKADFAACSTIFVSWVSAELCFSQNVGKFRSCGNKLQQEKEQAKGVSHR